MQRLNTLNLPSFIGFDRLFDEMDRAFENSANKGYPPYNLIKETDNNFTIELAVAGFGMDDLSITKEGNILNIEGTTGSSNDDVTYIHKGIGGRNFTRTFTLNDHVEVSNATLNNGILTIDLERIVPEALQPKKIAINSDNKTIEGKVHVPDDLKELAREAIEKHEEEKVKVS
jgi:molecular chaperone IbpA